jgi:predicted nucleotidyltransferase
VSNLLEQIKKLAQQNNDIAVVWLYGSRANGTARENSDYDIAVAFNSVEGTQFEKALKAEKLSMDWHGQLGLGDVELSIVNIIAIPTYLAISILDEGQVLAEKDSLRLAKEELRIMNQYEDLRFEQKRGLG